jgi:hypothetical protein
MDNDKIPTRSYDLIKLLDQTTYIPEPPTNIVQAGGFDDAAQRRILFAAGFRHMVDTLVELMNAEIRGEDDEPESAADGPGSGFARILGSDGDVRDASIGGWLDGRIPE